MFPAIVMLPVVASLLVLVALIATDPFAVEARR